MIPATRLFHGRTVRILGMTTLEVAFDLDFGVTLSRSVALMNTSRYEDSPELRRRAEHCLIVLLGGKQVLVAPDMTFRTEWGRTDYLRCQVYYTGRVTGTPLGLVEHMPGTDGPVLEVGPYMTYLQTCNYDVAAVKATINGH